MYLHGGVHSSIIIRIVSWCVNRKVIQKLVKNGIIVMEWEINVIEIVGFLEICHNCRVESN